MVQSGPEVLAPKAHLIFLPTLCQIINRLLNIGVELCRDVLCLLVGGAYFAEVVMRGAE